MSEYDASKHPRGNPANVGQFVKKHRADGPDLSPGSGVDPRIGIIGTQDQLDIAIARAIALDGDVDIAVHASPDAVLRITDLPTRVGVNQYGGTLCVFSSDLDHAPVIETHEGSVFVEGPAAVVASGSSTARARGGATVYAHDESTVTASGRVQVNAYDEAKIDAGFECYVSASGNCRVNLVDQAQCDATDTVHVDITAGICRASGHAAVNADGVGAFASLEDHASGEFRYGAHVGATGDSTVEVFDGAYATIRERAHCTLHKGGTVEIVGESPTFEIDPKSSPSSMSVIHRSERW